jgi:hypothetical protein
VPQAVPFPRPVFPLEHGRAAIADTMDVDAATLVGNVHIKSEHPDDGPTAAAAAAAAAVSPSDAAVLARVGQPAASLFNGVDEATGVRCEKALRKARAHTLTGWRCADGG